jgi:hypothetical protein
MMEQLIFLYSSYSASTSFTETPSSHTQKKKTLRPQQQAEENTKAGTGSRILTAAGLVGELGELTEGEAPASSEARACVESGKQPGRALLEAPRGREQGRVEHGEHGEQHRAR